VSRFVVISGCSGGGKSTLLAELARRGHAVVEEPGRRIVREELEGDGAALPWVDEAAFARRAVATASADLSAVAASSAWTFFDRGLVDAVAALLHATGEPAFDAFAAPRAYHRRMFMAPPWPEIYATDAERPHDVDVALAEYARLLDAYAMLGYVILTLPKASVAARADFVLEMLGK
jgi:predicted ATPase